jgi:cysteine desulfurase/selenocysteine lyase
MTNRNDTLVVGDDDPAFVALRRDLPILSRTTDAGRLVYLDSAASSLTPGRVLSAITGYYERSRANVHRGKHLLSEEASTLFEDAREKIAAFIGAEPATTIFSAGTTASINLVALGLRLRPDDVVVTTSADHHAVLLPFFDRCELRFVDVGADGVVDVDRVVDSVDARTRLVALAHGSNVTGRVHDVAAIAAAVKAKSPSTLVLVDAAQTVGHVPVSVRDLGADFLAFSSHKMLGPTGVGVLSGTRAALDALAVEVRGGGMVRLVDRTRYELRALPQKLEAGTPDIAGVIGLGAAVALLDELGIERIAAHGHALAQRLAHGVRDLPGAALLGPADGERLPLVSLVPRSTTVSADHLAMILSDTHGVMVRSGHFCCHPFFDALGLPGALRASAGPYNTTDDVDAFVDALRRVLATLLR